MTLVDRLMEADYEEKSKRHLHMADKDILAPTLPGEAAKRIRQLEATMEVVESALRMGPQYVLEALEAIKNTKA